MRKCKHCGCTDYSACIDPLTNEPCFWVSDDVCSACMAGQDSSLLSTAPSWPSQSRMVGIYTESQLDFLLSQRRELGVCH